MFLISALRIGEWQNKGQSNRSIWEREEVCLILKPFFCFYNLIKVLTDSSLSLNLPKNKCNNYVSIWMGPAHL